MKEFFWKVLFVIFLVGLGYFLYQAVLIEKEKFELKEKERKEKVVSLRKKPEKAYWQKPKETEIKSLKKKKEEEDFLVETKIISGPEEGEVLKETNIVTFEFEGKIISQKEIKKPIAFETKLEPQEKEWKTTYFSWRTLKLDPKIKEFRFLVRAKVGDKVDLTPEERTFFLDVSPYFGKIKIERVLKGETPVIVLKPADLEENEKIKISGFKIKGKKFQKEIKNAVKIWKPGAKEEKVFLEKNQKAYLIGANSPLGKSFLLNKCMGYLKENYKFYPSFYTYCPKPEKEELASLSEECQEFILKLGNCEIPDWQGNFTISKDEKCVDFLEEHFNYGSCLKNHQKDEDFFKNIWYLYLGEFSLNRFHDQIEIYDENQKLVFKYIY